MRSKFTIFFCLVSLPCPAQQVAIGTQLTDARIIGKISETYFSPPALVPKPVPVEVQSSRITTAHVVEAPPMDGVPAPQGLVHITVQRVNDPGLPDPAPPLATRNVLPRLGITTERTPRPVAVSVSATVYDHKRTHFRCYLNGDMRAVTSGWSNVDFIGFTGFSEFQTTDTTGVIRKYKFGIGLDYVDNEKRAALFAKHGRIYQAPALPALPDLQTAGPSFVIDEQEKAAASGCLAFIEGMHRIYKTDGKRLADAYGTKVREREERKAYLIANPPTPKDISLQFWKREKPVAGNQTEDTP